MSMIVAEELVDSIEVLRQAHVADLAGGTMMVFSGGEDVATAVGQVEAWMRVAQPESLDAEIIRGEIGVSVVLDITGVRQWAALLGLE
jgi:hypothetical protein